MSVSPQIPVQIEHPPTFDQLSYMKYIAALLITMTILEYELLLSKHEYKKFRFYYSFGDFKFIVFGNINCVYNKLKSHQLE